MPTTLSLDKANQCLLDLIELLKYPALASPFPQFGSKKLQAIEDLAKIFKDALPSKPTNMPTTVPSMQYVPLPRVQDNSFQRVKTLPPGQQNVMPQRPEPSHAGTRNDVAPPCH